MIRRLREAAAAAFNTLVPTGANTVENSFVSSILRSGGRIISRDITCAGVGQAVDLFDFTGPFRLLGIYARLTEATNVTDVTACNYNVDDGTVTVQLTSAAGVVLTGAAVGALLLKAGLSATALALMDSDQVRIHEDTAVERVRTVVNPLPGSANQVRFSYTSAQALTDFDLHVLLGYADLDEAAPSGLVAA